MYKQTNINTLTQKSTIPGITGQFMNGLFNTLLITVNTSEISVTGLSCSSIINERVVGNTTNLTILW